MGGLITVIVGVFGDAKWVDKAIVALDSAKNQTVPVPAMMIHAETLHDARNTGAEEADTEWLLFLDADDTLDPRYVEEMEKVIATIPAGTDALIQPGHVNSKDRPTGAAGEVSIIPWIPYQDGNCLIIGTLVRREQFMRVGGFRDLPMYEDWDLWIRCFLDGAKHYTCPKAIYEIEVNEASRNEQDLNEQMRVRNQIRSTYGFN